MPEPVMMETYPQRSLRDYYYILFRHKWKMILFFLVVMIIVLAITFLSEEVYQAEARLMVRLGRESVTLPPQATTGQIISFLDQSRESEINSELEILKSRELAQEVVDGLGPQFILNQGDEGNLKAGFVQDQIRSIRSSIQTVSHKLENLLKEMGVFTPLDNREKATIQLMRHLKIEAQVKNNILSISYKAQSPEQAQSVLAKFIDLYLERHITAHRNPGTYEFFGNQVDQMHNKLIKGERELNNLKKKTGVVSLEEQRRIIVGRIGSLQQEVESTQAALAISRAKVQDLRDKLAGLSETVITEKVQNRSKYGYELMRSKLYELKLKEQELLSKFTENSLPVQEIRRQIAEAEAMIDPEELTWTQVATGINATHQQLNLSLLTEMANLSSLEAKLREVKGQLRDARVDLRDFIDAEMTMTSLQRELALQDVKYRKYSENLEQARIDQALEMNKISNIRIIQTANSSTKPVWPRKTLNLALGFIFGILGGIGLAFFFEYLDHSLKTPQDIEEKLKLQALASIPYLEK